ncbi:cfap299 [Symbiodinium microadriaticum]|nr:cfap299 [Symbiodinium microadriaticum]
MMEEPLLAICRTSLELPERSNEVRWNLWSPKDRSWLEELKELWQDAVSRLESTPPQNMIPRRIHQIWLGPRRWPEPCERFAGEWKARHPTWEYRLWTDDDAGEELRGHPGLAKAADNPAEKSDILRLAIILRHGGLYVDVDFECLKPLDVLHSRASFYCGLSNVGAVEVNNGLFAATAGHPLVSYLCDHLGKPWPEWGQDDVDPKEAVAYQIQRSGMLEMPSLQAGGQAAFLATTGPGFFTRGLVKGLRLLRGQRDLGPMLVCPPEVFYPLPNTERGVPDAEFRMLSSLAVHHWFRTWNEAERTEAEESTAVLKKKRIVAYCARAAAALSVPCELQRQIGAMMASRGGGFLAFLNRSRQRYEEAMREAEAEKVEACASPFEWACEETSPTELPLPDSTEEASDRSEVAEALQDLPEDGCEAEEELRLPSADPSSHEVEDTARATVEDPPESVQDGCEAEEELRLPSADPSSHEVEDNARATVEDPPENVQDSEIEVLGPALADPERFDEEDFVEADGDGGGVEPEDVKAHLAKRRKRLATQLFAVPGRRRRMLAESWPKDSHAVNAKVELHQGLKQEVPIKREAVKRELAAFPSDPSSADDMPGGALLKRRRRGGAGAERTQADAVGDRTPENAGRMMQGLPHADLLRLAGQLEHRYLGTSEWQSVPVVVHADRSASNSSAQNPLEAMEDDYAHPYEDSIEKFTTYEDYLDSQITPQDRFYLEEDELARQLVEIGCRKGEVLTREDFAARREAAENAKKARLQSAPKVLASAQKKLTDFPVLRHLACREELVRSGKLSTIIFIRDKNHRGQEISGYIDYGHRLKTENFEPYFERKKRLLPKSSDLSFYNWDTQHSTSNESPNFQILPDHEQGLLFKNKRDRKVLSVDPRSEPGDNSKRLEVPTTEYIQVVIFDHMTRKKS